MKLKDTVDLMLSDDWKDRLKAEYWQTKIRYDKLEAMIARYEDGTLIRRPTYDIDMMKTQLNDMYDYIFTLEERSSLDGINLDWDGGGNG